MTRLKGVPLEGAGPDEDFSSGLLSWRGPPKLVVRLESAGAVMAPQTARHAVDFAFRLPTPRLTLELACGDPERVLAPLWFAAQYARRRCEWARRAVAVVARCETEPSPGMLSRLDGLGLEWRLRVRASAAPRAPRVARPAELLVGRGAKGASAWVRAFAEAGLRSFAVRPDRSRPPEAGELAAFYAEALDAALACESLVEETAAAALSRRRDALHGYDVLAELAVAADGALATSEAALDLGDDADLFRLGTVDSTRYADLKKAPVVRAALMSAIADNQPLCHQCAYRASCAVPPSLSAAETGTPWGRTPESAECARRMALLDELFSRRGREDLAPAFSRWSGGAEAS
jgi:hypothetical protein